MGRWLLVLLLAIGLGRLIVPVSVATSCFEQCEDDNDDGDCAPGCDDCSCCARVSIVTPDLAVSPAVALVLRATPASSTLLPPSADSRQLLDVPKAS